MIKFLIGGSPCVFWSIARSKNRETQANGEGWRLFENYLIAKERFKPDFFLYENNKSIAPPIKTAISQALGVPLQHINSALVSAQNRERFYAHNFGDVPLPEDKGILLKDILESGVSFREKSYCLDANYYRGGNLSSFEKQSGKRLMVAEPVMFQSPRGFNKGGIKYDKAPTITASKYQDNNFVVENALIRVGRIEKQNKSPPIHDSKAYRVYSQYGKSVCICGEAGGGGARTGLYACAVNPTVTGKAQCLRTTYFKSGVRNIVGNNIDRQTGVAVHVSGENAVNEPIYEVKNGLIEIKGNRYPIKLPDGFYVIRKLTVTECCRLQNLPDDYCRAVSASRGYAGLGNGWTSGIITHLLSYALAGVPKDERIIVLSMYDGIATGRFCFDSLGYKNIAYYAYELDPYAIRIAKSNFGDIIHCGDAFAVRESDWFMERAVEMWGRFYSKNS